MHARPHARTVSGGRIQDKPQVPSACLMLGAIRVEVYLGVAPMQQADKGVDQGPWHQLLGGAGLHRDQPS